MKSYHVDVSYISDWMWSDWMPALGQVNNLENSNLCLECDIEFESATPRKNKDNTDVMGLRNKRFIPLGAQAHFLFSFIVLKLTL